MNHTATRRGGLALAFAVAALGLAACGSSGSGSSSASGSTPSSATSIPPRESPIYQSLVNGRYGHTLTALDHADFRHLDPGQADDSLDDQLVAATQRTLYAYLPNDTHTAVPDLASGQPVVSPDGLTVTVALKQGIHFSPPVDREVTAADVVYAFDRAANPHVANPYFRTYFGDLVGAARAHGRPFAGVIATGRYTLVFHLLKPTAPILVAALVLPITAPVPAEFARPLDAHAPTLYGEGSLVATGPYMVRNNALGQVRGVGYVPGRSVDLIRNPGWNSFTDFRPAYLNRIEIQIGQTAASIGFSIFNGIWTVQGDTPIAAVVSSGNEDVNREQNPIQVLTISPGAGLRYIALNNRSGPFANVDVRRALYAALDRTAIVAANGGALEGAVATHFLYPGTGGFDQAGGYSGPQPDFNQFPGGNTTLAAHYMTLAGYANGHSGGGELSVLGFGGKAGLASARIVNMTLAHLGFRTHLRLVNSPTLLKRECARPRLPVDVCIGLVHTRDFPDPQTIIDPLFNGGQITPINSTNIGRVDEPALNTAMEAAARIPVANAPARGQAWATIDDQLVAQAVAIPIQFMAGPAIESPDVNGVSQQWNNGLWDYAFTSLKSHQSAP